TATAAMPGGHDQRLDDVEDGIGVLVTTKIHGFRHQLTELHERRVHHAFGQVARTPTQVRDVWPLLDQLGQDLVLHVGPLKSKLVESAQAFEQVDVVVVVPCQQVVNHAVHVLHHRTELHGHNGAAFGQRLDDSHASRQHTLTTWW